MHCFISSDDVNLYVRCNISTTFTSFWQEMNLEDKFLKKNIPGKFSTWWGNDDQPQTLDEVEIESDTSSVDKISGDKYTISSNGNLTDRGNARTGVKGVKEDYKHHLMMEQRKRHLYEDQRKESLNSIAYALRSNGGDDCIFKSSQSEDTDEEKSACTNSEDDSDNTIYAQYREKRLYELKRQVKEEFVSEVTPEEFSRIIDDEENERFILVHLYDESVESCKILDGKIEEIVRMVGKHRVRGLKLNAFDANEKLDPIALPTLMVYKSGALVHVFTRIKDDLLHGYSALDLYEFLRAHGVF